VRTAFSLTPGADSVATAAARLGDDGAVVRAASPLAPGAVFAVEDSDALDSNTHHGAATADSVEDACSVLAAVCGGGVSKVVDVDGSTTYPLTLSVEWKSAAEEVDVLTESLVHLHALPVNIFEEASDLAVNRSVISYQHPS